MRSSRADFSIPRNSFLHIEFAAQDITALGGLELLWRYLALIELGRRVRTLLSRYEVGGGVWKTATVWLEHLGMDEKRDNIQMIVIGDVTVLAQSIEAGLIDATVVPGYLSRRLAAKGFTVLGRCEETRFPQSA